MLRKSTSPLRDQLREYERSISSEALFGPGIVRKQPGISPTRDGNSPMCERCESVSRPAYSDSDWWDGTTLETAVHDLRHPAAALAIYSELLKETAGDRVTEEQQALIDSINSTSRFMLRLLDDTVDFANLQSRTVRLRTVPSTVAAAVTACVAIGRPLAARKQMSLNLVQEGEPLHVLLDRVNISRVFNNLIENAIKYCQPGATINVEISRTREMVQVCVQDDGPGINSSDLKTLFTPFQRTHARARDDHGTGLGLVISKQIVELHGGQLGVESKVGKGTTFYVSLPAYASLSGHVRETPKKS